MDDAKIRVLYVIPGTEQSKTMSFSRRQMESVGKFGVEVQPFYLKSRTSPTTTIRELWRLGREIGEFAPDIVHAHFGTMTAFVAAVASRKPLVITFHGSDLNPAPGDFWLRAKLARTLSHLAALRAARIICVSSQLSDRIAYHSGRVHIVPCGVNLKLFRPASRDECRAKLGWSIDEKVVLFNARTDPVGKRLGLAETAVALAQRQIPNLRLHVFRGSTPPDEMPLFYSAADCLLMTSDYEGSPMVVKEALACNLPVVSVDVGDVAERLQGIWPSRIVARNPDALGRALVEILNAERRSNGRDRMRDLSEESVADQVVSIYRLTLSAPTSRMIELVPALSRPV